MPYKSDIREANVADDDVATVLTELGGASPGDFDVPGDVKRITEVNIAVAPDWTADAMYAASFHVVLSGDLQVGHGAFPGPLVSTAGAVATSAGSHYGPFQRVQTNIPVTAGGSIKATAYMGGEDIGEASVMCQLVYDGFPGRIVDMDVREENLAAANTPVSLQAKQAAASGDFKVGRPAIAEVHFGAAFKFVAGPLRALPVLQLSGAGIAGGGPNWFMGPSGGVQDDVAISGDMVVMPLSRYICGPLGIKTNKGNTINASAQMIEDDAGTGMAIVALGYL